MDNARLAAANALIKTEKQSAYSNIALDLSLKESSLDERDSSFAAALVYGVTERKITLDYILSRFSNIKLEKLQTEVLQILRLSAFQILFLDKIPHSAAVNEGVKLAAKLRCGFAKGYMNAVLRNIVRALPLDLTFSGIEDDDFRLSVKYSCPLPLIRLWRESYPDHLEALLASTLENPPVTLRVNTIKTNEETCMELLKKAGMPSERTGLENALTVKSTGNLERLDSFQKGLFHVQDLSSQLSVAALNPQKGEVVLDICAAPGGKSFTAAQLMKNEGSILSLDIYPHKIKQIEEGANRLGINIIRSEMNDATKKSSLGLFDKIICDLPCSGLGIIRKKPEIKYKALDALDKLIEIQYLILCNAASYLKKGGTLVYSTCTLNRSENENQVGRFLKEHLNFSEKVLPGFISANNKEEYMKTFFPHIDKCDGFFIACLTRTR